ncbi:MAG: diguanylate cyclase [Myxococcota bacterium]
MTLPHIVLSAIRPGVVLIVDDEAFSRRLLADAMAADGHLVRTADTGEDALAVLETEPVDVVLVDLVMPGMGGMRLIERARQRDPHLELVVCTSVKDVDTAVTAMRAGASDYLVKPISPGALRLAVARSLERRRLLGENQRLRRDLELVRASHRLLSTMDERRVCEMALEDLLRLTGGFAGALGRPGAVMACRELSDAHAALALALASRQAESSPVEDVGQLEEELIALGPALVVWLGSGADAVRGLIARRCGQAPLEAGELEAAQFLMRHAQTALENLQRYTAAAEAARRDSLTGLFNAAVLEEALVQEVMRGKETGQPCALLFLDLDDFKRINDAHGHLMGSKLLVELAGVLRRAVREGDIISRWGGDEYAVVLLDAEDADARVVAERVRGIIENHHFLLREGLRVKVTVSMGVALFPRDGTTARDLLAKADADMYRAKTKGKNAVVCTG